MIEFKNVKFNIKNIDIVNNLNFVINDNTVTCFVGNKNSGKTSILKLISKIYKNYYGEILIDGIDISNIKILNIGVVFDDREQNTDLSVMEYLEFYGGLNSKHKAKELNNTIETYLKMFSLMSYKHTDVNMLDNESYKLLEIIRVMMNNPDIILFDNLFFSDNPEFNDRFLELVKKMVGRKTLIFACRSLNYIENICEYIGVMDAGSLLAFGKKDEVYKLASLKNKIEVEVKDGLQEAIEILKKNDNITNIVYEDNKIIFSIVEDYLGTKEKGELESKILKTLIDNSISVYSFKKEQVGFERLFGRLKE
ncbi:MAG: ATP-binding cassette domain-containing protein [Lachnospiraceae bacterium]|nr:ATP-binding cassette domain-containing protein [Lachnospiraceae bacterium]